MRNKKLAQHQFFIPHSSFLIKNQSLNWKPNFTPKLLASGKSR